MYLHMDKIKATFTVDKNLWKKFKILVITSEKKYSQVLEELIKKYIEEYKSSR